MKKLKILALCHADLVPPEAPPADVDVETAPWKMEFDVIQTLRELGHEVRPVGVLDQLGVLRQAIEEWKPDIAFNLLEEFAGEALYDQNVVSYLELHGLPYTGCNPRGLMLAHDKALSKKVMAYHRIRVPDFTVVRRGQKVRRRKRLQFPLIVKSLVEEASMGISQASVVHNDQSLEERVKFIHESTSTDAIVETYIEGRELYVGVIGNERLQVYPVWELILSKLPDHAEKIATSKVKWDHKYQKKYGITSEEAKDLDPAVATAIKRLCKRVYRSLELSGYARIDLRLTEGGRAHVLEANPNPQLAYGEDFSESAERAGQSYEQLLQRILRLGLAWRAVKTP